MLVHSPQNYDSTRRGAQPSSWVVAGLASLIDGHLKVTMSPEGAF